MSQDGMLALTGGNIHWYLQNVNPLLGTLVPIVAKYELVDVLIDSVNGDLIKKAKLQQVKELSWTMIVPQPDLVVSFQTATSKREYLGIIAELQFNPLRIHQNGGIVEHNKQEFKILAHTEEQSKTFLPPILFIAADGMRGCISKWVVTAEQMNTLFSGSGSGIVKA